MHSKNERVVVTASHMQSRQHVDQQANRSKNGQDADADNQN